MLKTIFLAAALSLLLPVVADAGQVAGQTFFERVPRLVRSATDNISTTYNYARYSFEVAVPPDSGEPLGSLTIAIPERIRMPDAGMVRAVGGDGRQIPLADVAIRERTVAIRFAQPVAPGNRAVVEFYPMRNPRVGGAYLFEVTALPAGVAPRPQFLSFGRIQFYSPGGGSR